MAQLPTSFNAPQSNISDGSNLISAALGLNRDINKFGNKAFSTISDFAKEQANQALAGTFASNIANGMDPTSAMQGALGKVNSWTSAEAINNLATQRNYEQASLRKEALLDIQKAQENRALQDWTGMNEAAEANLSLESGYNTNNSSVYNQGLSKASELSDKAKKFIKMKNLAKQQDEFATSAVSRANTKLLTDNMRDKKLASQLDAEFKIIKSQNPLITNAQVAQKVALRNNLSPYQVNLILNQYGYGSGQSVLDEASSNLSHTVTQETVDTYNNAQNTLDTLNVDIQGALGGKTEQNKKDQNTTLNILTGELISVRDTSTNPVVREQSAAMGLSATTRIPKKEAKEIVSSLINNPSKENFERIKHVLEARGHSGHFVDWLTSNFIVENGKVKLSPNTAANINSALSQEVIGDTTRADVLAGAQIDKNRTSLGINKVVQAEDYRKLNALAQKDKNSFTPEDQQELAQLALNLNQREKIIGEQQGEVANAALMQNPSQGINRTYNTFRDIVEPNKVITTKQLVDKGLTDSQAKKVIERIRDVEEEAQDSKEYKDLSSVAIAYAVLDDYTRTNDNWYDMFLNPSDKDFLKKAAVFQDMLLSLQGQSSLENTAQKISKVDAQIQTNKHLSGY